MHELDATIKKSPKMWVKKNIENLVPIDNSLAIMLRVQKNSH